MRRIQRPSTVPHRYPAHARSQNNFFGIPLPSAARTQAQRGSAAICFQDCGQMCIVRSLNPLKRFGASFHYRLELNDSDKSQTHTQHLPKKRITTGKDS